MEETIVLLRVGIFFLLLGFSAVFSGSEVALFSLTPVQVEMLRDKRGTAGRLVAQLLSDPRRLLVTIYIGNEIVNVAIAAVSTMLALHFFGEHGVAVAIGVGTFLLLLFGEISPKTFALKYAQSYALAVARPLFWFAKLIYPIEATITWMADKLLSLTGSEDIKRPAITEEEMKSVLAHGENNGVIKSDEKEMIFNIFELGDTDVTDIMTPRKEIFSLSADGELGALVKQAVHSNFSRIPVYRKEKDRIIGILYTKDLLVPELEKNLVRIDDILHEPFFVPPTKKIDDLLRDFRKRQKHVAIIVDEYGGIEGMVTLDDILEMVVGEPPDSKNLLEIRKIDEGQYYVPGRLSLDDFNDYFGTDFSNDEIDTIGGFVFHLFGRMPMWGESVKIGNAEFMIHRLKGVSISQLYVKISGDNGEGSSPDGERGKS